MKNNRNQGLLKTFLPGYYYYKYFCSKLCNKNLLKALLGIIVFCLGINIMIAQDSAITKMAVADTSLNVSADTTGSIVPDQTVVTVKNEANEEPLEVIPFDFKSNNLTFFLLLLLVAFPAVFKFLFPSQFNSLFSMFKNPMLSTRNLKEHINQNSQTSALFYLFYSYSFSLFLYFAFFIPKGASENQISGVIIITLFAILCIAFVLKYGFLKLTGWVFNIEEHTEGYLFQTLVFNRILSLAIIPFTIFLAIGHTSLHKIILILACILIAVLFINRYFKSGGIWRQFLKYGKLHFFLYLCASEILPMAILIKIITT